MVGDFQYYVLCVGERGGGERESLCVCACARKREGEIFLMRMCIYRKGERAGKGEQEQ